jgi:hypothetical protein
LRQEAIVMPQDARTADPAADVRAEIARQMLPIYRVAAKVDMHPATLSRFLRGHRPLSPELEAKIRQALRDGEEAA